MAKEEKKKWIERLRFDYTVLEGYTGSEAKMRFEIEVPIGAEFIGAQHDATILVMLVRDRFGAENPGGSGRIMTMEKRVVIRVKDGVMIEEKGSRYIGSDGGWHLFEVLPGKAR